MGRIWFEPRELGTAVYYEVFCAVCRALHTGTIHTEGKPLTETDVLKEEHWSFLEGRILCTECTEARLRNYALYDEDLEF